MSATFLRSLSLLLLAAASLANAAPALARQTPGLKVSENKRFLVTADGRPFFWLGDTAWELFHRPTREEAIRYLRKRAEQRFTVIQAVALAEFDGLERAERLRPPAARQQRSGDPRRQGRPRQRLLGSRGLRREPGGRARALHRVPADVGRQVEASDRALGRRSSRRRTPSSTAPGSAALQGHAEHHLDPRRRPPDRHRHAPEIIRAMARGLRAGDGGAHLMTFHPPGGNSSSTWFHDEAWLDFNMRQNGHARRVHRPLRPDTRRLRPHADQARARR